MPRLARTPWTRRLHTTHAPLLGLQGPCLATASHPPALPIRLTPLAAPSKRRAPPPLPPALNLGTRSGLGPSARPPRALRAPGCHRAWPPGPWRRAKGWPAALAGNRTRVNCLEGSYAHHYTTNAAQPGPPPDARPGFPPGACTRSGHRLWSPPPPPSEPRPCPDDPPIHSAALLHAPAAAAGRPTRAGPARLGGSAGPPPASGGRSGRRAAPGTTPAPPRPLRPLRRHGNPVPRDPRPSRHALAPALLHRVLGEATSRAHGGPDATAAHPSLPPRRAAPRPAPSGPLHPSPAPAGPGSVE